MLNFGHNCAVKMCSQERLLLFTPIFSLPMGGPPIPTFCLSLPAFASHSEFLPPDLHITRWVGAHLLPPLLPTPIFLLPHFYLFFRSVVGRLGLFFKQSTPVAPVATQSTDLASSTSDDPVLELSSIDFQERRRKKVFLRQHCVFD